MPSWETQTLADTLDLQRGHDLPSDQRRHGAVPIIGSFGVTGHHDEARYMGPGVAIGRSGASIGKATFVAEDYWPLNTCLFVNNFHDNDPRWIYHLLTTIDFTAYNSGSAQPSLNRNYLKGISVSLPPLPEQQAIAEVLGALDDKIAANRALAETASALVDAQYARSSTGILDSVSLGDRATLVLGGTPSKDEPSFWEPGGSIPWLASGKANEARIFEPTAWISEQALARSAAKMMPPAATVVAITGATLGQIGRLEFSACGNQSLVGIWAEDPHLNDWIYCSIRASVNDLLAKATGGAQQHVNKQDVASLQIPTLAGSALESFGIRTRPLLDLAASADREALALSRLRDALLPALMDGTIRVKDAEKITEGAL